MEHGHILRIRLLPLFNVHAVRQESRTLSIWANGVGLHGHSFGHMDEWPNLWPMHVGWLSLDAERWQTRSVRRKQRSTLVESASATPISTSIAALAAAALAAAALAGPAAADGTPARNEPAERRTCEL